MLTMKRSLAPVSLTPSSHPDPDPSPIAIAMADELTRMGRYGLIGILAVIVHGTIAFALLLTTPIAPLAAHTAGFLAGFVVSGVGHARWTFDVEGAHLPPLMRFFLVACAALVISEFVMAACLYTFDLDKLAAQAAALFTSAGFSYLGSRLWAFRRFK